MNDSTDLTDEQLDKLFDDLLPPNEELDSVTASIILERQGVDRPRLAAALSECFSESNKRPSMINSLFTPNSIAVVQVINILTNDRAPWFKG